MKNNSTSHKQTMGTSQMNKPSNKKNNLHKQWVANEEPPSLKTGVKEFIKIDGNTTSYSMNGIKANARIWVQQDVDLVLKKLKLNFLGQRNQKVPITTDPRYKQMKTALYSNMAYCSKNITEKRVAPNTTKFSYQID